MRKTKLILTCFVGLVGAIAAVAPAQAVVCAAGVHRAGCVGPNGAVAVRKPAPVTTCRFVNGVRVCKRHWR